ncbi:Bifunctional uridylyltransferase/uridylyl-removing enzyme [uncultured archaeon]|nr:Bifunctional uridylyltransferase/uridylyl-removing enzyme [uncultured archaeon]
MIKELMVIANDKVGLLAEISYVLAKEKINIEQIDVNVMGAKAVILIGVLSARYEKAKGAVEKNGYAVLPAESLIVKLDDRPGELAALARRLADARINILNVHVLNKQGEAVYDSITVDKPREARKVLGSAVVNEEAQ